MSRGIWWVGARLTDSPGSARREDGQGVTGTLMKMSAINSPLITWAPQTDTCHETQGPIRTTGPSPNSFLPELSSHRPEGSLNDVLRGPSHLTRSESLIGDPFLKIREFSFHFLGFFRRGAAPPYPAHHFHDPRLSLASRSVVLTFRTG